jgi:cell division protein FtsW (lipid II flippase)
VDSATERHRWFWILWTLCLLGQIGVGIYSSVEPTSVWPWHFALVLIVTFGSAFSLLPLCWFLLPDLRMHRAWIIIALAHPVLLVVPVLIGRKSINQRPPVAP